MTNVHDLSQAELKDRKAEPLPSGWTVDKSGHVSYLVTDFAILFLFYLT